MDVFIINMLRYVCYLLFSFVTMNTFANTESVIIVAEHMPPYQILDNKPAGGYSIEIIQQVMKKANIDYSFIPMNWERAYNFVQKKPNTILLSIARYPTREPLFHWLFKINPALKTSIWTAKYNKHQINALSEVTNEVFAEVTNSLNQNLLDKYSNISKKNLILTTDKEQVISLVAKQRADFMLVNEDILNWRLKSLNIAKNNFRKVLELNSSTNELYIAANKTTSPLLIKKITIAYQKMLADGSIAAIKEKWFGEYKQIKNIE